MSTENETNLVSANPTQIAVLDKKVDETIHDIKRGAEEVYSVMEQSKPEVDSLINRFNSMSPAGKLVTISGLILGAKVLSKIVPTKYILIGVPLYLFIRRNNQ